MGRYCLLRLIILFVLSQGVAASRAAEAPEQVNMPRDNPLSVLFRRNPSTKLREDLERRMATVSIIMALLALGVAVPTLVWCKKLSESVTRLIVDTSGTDGRKRLAELANESQSLRAQADRLRQSWQTDTTRLESAVGQLESRIVELEQARSNLGTVSQDLESLRNFRTQVEQIHARIQKAFNGALAGTSSATLREEMSPRADA